jgi:hypothetical protein
MAYTLNGIGTRFYGKRDFHGDGSYITTEWVTFVYIPILPFRSLRVRHLGAAEPRFSIFPGTVDQYQILEKTPPNGRQVFYTYGFFLFVVAWAALVLSIGCDMKEPALGMPIALGGPWLPAVIPWLLRQRAREQVRG